MNLKNYVFHLRELFKEIKNENYNKITKEYILNNKNILSFKKDLKTKNKKNYNFYDDEDTLFYIVIKFCLKNKFNKMLEYLQNILNIKQDYINNYTESLLTIAVKYKNYKFIKENFKHIEYNFIEKNINLIDTKIFKMIREDIFKEKIQNLIYELASYKNINKDNELLFCYLIDKYGYNKYYKTNGILYCLCGNGHLNLIHYLHKNNLIDADIDFNDFLYPAIKNNHEDVFVFFLENYNINIHYKYDSLFYRIFLFDRVNFLKILDKNNILNRKLLKNEADKMVDFASWNCFQYLLKNNYIKNKDFFINPIYTFSNIKKCFYVTNLDFNINIKEYKEKKIQFLNYILNNINKKDLNYIILELFTLFIKNHINKEFHNIENNELNLEDDNNKIKLILHFYLEKEIIIFIINNKNNIKKELYDKTINWLFVHSLHSNNIFIINILLQNKQKINKKYINKADVYSAFYDYLQSSFHYIEFEDLKFLVDFFNIDLSYNNNCLLYYFLSNSDAFVNKDYNNIIDYFLSNKRVQEKLTEDVACDCYHGKDKVLEKIKKIKKIQNF